MKIAFLSLALLASALPSFAQEPQTAVECTDGYADGGRTLRITEGSAEDTFSVQWIQKDQFLGDSAIAEWASVSKKRCKLSLTPCVELQAENAAGQSFQFFMNYGGHGEDFGSDMEMTLSKNQPSEHIELSCSPWTFQ